MKLIKYCSRIIEYSFYSLFLLVPLVFSSSTSELFELNKMWLAFGGTTIIMTAWIAKMVLQRKIVIQRTPLDILLMLFLLSQIISTLISLDQQISWWGYYSRFNGGLASTICYILLYYAFVSNLAFKHVIKALHVTLITGLATALWGFPSHFGYDPTCLVFRGTFDTSCWTEAFRPTIRTFSTLGQPAWFAAYLALLLPLTMGYALMKKNKFWLFLPLAIFFYISLIFTDTRAGFLAFWIANGIFWTILFLKKVFSRTFFFKMFTFFNISFILCSFFLGSPLGPLTKFTLPHLMQQEKSTEQKPSQTPPEATQSIPGSDTGITDSGNIRLLVWNGAVEAWKHNPIFGSGVETFAFAYYKYKSPTHNLTSEWDYLYNKAHNEYLNYLTTTGLFGLGTYLAFIGWFVVRTLRRIIYFNLSQTDHKNRIISPAPVFSFMFILSLLAGYISILVSNFFGFSVVIINLYFFLIPLFIFMLGDMLKSDNTLTFAFGEPSKTTNPYQWTCITILLFIAGWILIGLLTYRQADIAYALGNNLDKTNSYQEAYPLLVKAFKSQPDEPVYGDELSINLGALSAALYAQKDATTSAQFAKDAITVSDQVVTKHPNNVVYWKNRVRLFYTLSNTDPANQAQYLQEAIRAIDKAKELAPTDAKIAYNQAILYGQIGEYEKAADMLLKTIKLKPDYRDAYVALGLFYHQQAVDKNGKVDPTRSELHNKAIETYEYILTHISPADEEVQKTLAEWKK